MRTTLTLRTSGMKLPEVARLLQHAEWHCRFGSEEFIRDPEASDLEAAKIIAQLRRTL